MNTTTTVKDRYTTVTDEHGNRTAFPDGQVPELVHGAPVEIISTGLTWEEAHDWIEGTPAE